jgi:Uma2 family endonuclease
MDVIAAAPPVTDLPFVRRRITVDEYYRMSEVGILRPGERTELIDGGLVAMSPANSPHTRVVARLNRFFNRWAADRVFVISQSPVRLDDHNMPEPDLALLRPKADDYWSRLAGPADILLLVETADSTLRYDRAVKLPLYARSGIPEYWIIDVQGQAVEVCRSPENGQYTSIDRMGVDRTLVPPCLPDLSVPVASLFG